jgi:hypothetical protein
MSLYFDGRQYTTIQDVKDRFRVAEKTIKKWIKRGWVPEPEFVQIGTRRFRYFSDAWMQAFERTLREQRFRAANDQDTPATLS